MEFINCRFENAQEAAITVADKPVTGARVSFVNCEIVNPAANQSRTTPIVFTCEANGMSTVGGVEFGGCTILDTLERLPMSFEDMSGVGWSDITGTITVKRGVQETVNRLTPKLIGEWMPVRTFKQFARFNVKGRRCEPAFPDAQLAATQHTAARQRGHSEWLLWSEAAEQVSFNVLVQPVGKGDPQSVPVSLISPSGKLTKMPAAQGGKENAYKFQAAERGVYTIVCEPQNWTATVNSPDHRFCLYSPSTLFHFLGTTGQFWFWVPPGTKEFGVKASGEGGAERVRAGLYDPAGVTINEQDNIGQAHQFVTTLNEASDGEAWSLRFDRPSAGVLEDFYVQLQGIPPLLSPTREGLLRPVD